MKLCFTLFCLVFCGFTLQAQDITGIWRGYFYSGYGIYRQQYKYEVQINQLNGKRGPGNAKAIKGVTYSYRLTSFFGKANFVGIYNDQTKEITLSEDTLVEVKMDVQSFSCLMTCYLEYHKTGNTEVLQGSFSSVVNKKGGDCGSGSVYLERVPESDFHKEAFLLKKRPADIDTDTKAEKHAAPLPKKDSAAAAKTRNNSPAKPGNAAPAQKSPQTVKSDVPKKPATASNKTKQPVGRPPVASTTDSVVRTSPQPGPTVAVAPPTDDQIKKHVPAVPDVIKERANPLVKTVVTTSPDIKIELYDNGEVDGDTITVYHNNQLVVFKKGLTTNPITINIKATPEETHHELIMVADNLGSIPPNTALMVLTTGGKRYEIFISSDEQRNAKVVIDYKAPGKNPGQ
jgi:predicted CopG family antitoxin